MNFKPSLRLGSQEVVLGLTIQMSAYFCAVLKNSYFRHCSGVSFQWCMSINVMPSNH